MKMFVMLLSFLTIFPVLCLAVDPVNATCPFPLQLDTDTNFYYRYLDIPTGFTRINFEVKADNDVHIALFPEKGSSQYYLIVIGSNRNTETDIRRCSPCRDVDVWGEAGIVNQVEYHRFWITFSCNGTIAVGRNDDATPLVEWTDPNPLDVKYMGYSTGWGSTGEFRFCKFGEEHVIVRENFVLFVSCDPDSVIQIIDAFYGSDPTVCETTRDNDAEGSAEGGQHCFAENSKQIVSSACDHRQYCTVVASNEVFGNLCVQTQKYLRVNYMCISDSYLTSPSSSPSVSSKIASNEAFPTTGNTTFDERTKEKQSPQQNLPQIKLAEEAPFWPTVTICLICLVLLTVAIVAAWKLIQTNRPRLEIPLHRLD